MRRPSAPKPSSTASSPNVPKRPFSNAPRRSASTARGRPLVHEGRVVVAAIASGDAWIDELSPEVNPLDEPTRRALAAQWLDDALAEHASIAAFTRVAAQLLALGAPPELVEGAHHAALDEVRHAKLCFTLASMYGGAWKAPGSLDIGAVRKARCDLAALACEALVEGCLGEGTASALARRAAQHCTDPDVTRCLVTIAEDEARHEGLAWSIFTWSLERGNDDVAAAVAQALHAMPGTIPGVELPTGVDRGTWSAAGRVLPEEVAAAHAAVAAAVAARAWQHPKMATHITAVTPRRAQPRSRR